VTVKGQRDDQRSSPSSRCLLVVVERSPCWDRPVEFRRDVLNQLTCEGMKTTSKEFDLRLERVRPILRLGPATFDHTGPQGDYYRPSRYTGIGKAVPPGRARCDKRCELA
jgi:hypothetical protein